MHLLPLVLLLAGSPASPPPAATDAAGFAQRVAACEPSAFSTPHPFVSGFDSEHRIAGEQDGTCRYTQSMPGGMRMECAFTEAGRQAFAAEFKALAAGRMQGGTDQAPAWTDECEIVTATGQRLPAFGEGEVKK